MLKNQMKRKLLQSFKGLHFGIFIVTVLTVLVLAFTACTDEDEKTPNPTPATVLSDFFSIQNAVTVQGTIPSNPDGPSIGNVSMNGSVISGGSSHITITTDNDIQKLYVGIKGVNNYYIITPNAKSNIFDFVILLSQNLDESFEIQISALLADGTTTAVYKSTVGYYAVGTGNLQISLSFDNEKDVDLYVLQPDGVMIFYGNKGGQTYDPITGLSTYLWGLDLDSNPNCNIDSINNENVFYPDSLVQSGTYQVWINMYNNCDSSIPTTCIVTALDSGQFIIPIYGVNPSTTVFPIGQLSNPIGNDTVGSIKVMEFTIAGPTTTPKKIYNTKLTESAKIKMLGAKRR